MDHAGRFSYGAGAILVAIAGLVGGFVSTLASNGSSVTLPALELFGLPEHVANGTNRLSVVALGLVGTISFARKRLIDWRKGAWIAALIAAGTIVGSLAATRLSDAALDAIVIAGLLLVVGLQSLLIFGETGEVDWSAGLPLALGSAAGAYVAVRLVTRPSAKAWVYRFLVLVVVLSIVHLVMVDSTKFLQHT